MTSTPIQLTPALLNQKEYSIFGDVIGSRDDKKPIQVNMGTAERFGFLAKLENLRPEKAKPNFSFFRCNPMIALGEKHFDVRVLERHLHSTQAFIPMSGAKRFLVIVCLGQDRPELSTCRAFIASNSQGITYGPGVWHHPLVAMDQLSEFACLVWEDGSGGDCDVVQLTSPLQILLPQNFTSSVSSDS